MKRVILSIGLAIGPLLASGAHAEVDGSAPALCAAMEIMECVPNAACERISAQEAGIPRFLHVDFAENRISRTREGEEVSSEIERSEEVDNRIILQGAEDGFDQVPDGIGWSLSIDKSSGDMVLTGSGHAVGFVIFGACTSR